MIEPIDWSPTLSGERVRLRPIVTSDFESLFAVAADPLLWEQHPERDRFKLDVFRKFFDEGLRMGGLIVLDAETGETIGSSRFYDYSPEKNRVAIGYTFLSRSRWGGDFNRSLKSLMLAYAFERVEAVIFHIGETNFRSQRAVLKLGAYLTEERDETRSSRLVFCLRRNGPFRG